MKLLQRKKLLQQKRPQRNKNSREAAWRLPQADDLFLQESPVIRTPKGKASERKKQKEILQYK